MAASGTSTTGIYRVGPILAGTVLGYVRDIGRFATRHRFASYNGTAPIEVSSGDRVIYRRGNRQLNYVIHMAAVSQIRHRGSEGRAYYDKKIADGMTGKCALRSLERKISDTLYQRMLEDARRPDTGTSKDPGGQSGNDAAPSAAGSHPDRPALRTSHSRATPPTLEPPPASKPCSHPGLLLLGAELAGAQPESRWSPARARAAGAGRNDLDAGEHRPTLPAQEQADPRT